ncbi:Imidazole glycerol phosphate synthase amidotransferase subunit HisH [Olavius algarvensis associated proteobacterium Delta 3]|nr:Imidazole glycerol phosphate synthase amidotransferase subunit HisH [Olavius algarvensis associated proteobacterium Delta 3]CAB5114098.1 Imidazole glycerol phosphate synthase amidotransferase subunit HisH [Olavius algarvensis associated proteobacterium Delta 3]
MKEPMVAIIDYQMGNMFSVKHACDHVGINATITSAPEAILSADAAILPGVGAFGAAMENLRTLDLSGPIQEFIGSGRPFFGICLGMQLLFSESEEFGDSPGLDIIDGKVFKFCQSESCRVPHMGWSPIIPIEEGGLPWAGTPLQELCRGEWVYFVHSYYVLPNESSCVLSQTPYEGVLFCSSLSVDNIFATQFHPEKSGKSGLSIYAGWKRMIENWS